MQIYKANVNMWFCCTTQCLYRDQNHLTVQNNLTMLERGKRCQIDAKSLVFLSFKPKNGAGPFLKI